MKLEKRLRLLNVRGFQFAVTAWWSCRTARRRRYIWCPQNWNKIEIKRQNKFRFESTK